MRAIVDATASERSATGAVIFTSNELWSVTRSESTKFMLQAGPLVGSKNPRAVFPLREPVLDGGDNFFLRLGDAGYGGVLKASEDELFPSWAYRDLWSGIHLLYAIVYGPNVVFQNALGETAPTTPEIVANAATMALLKADRRKLNTVYFVQRTEQPLGAVPDLQPQQWIEAIVKAVDRAAPQLREINEVYLVASVNLEEKSQAVASKRAPNDKASVKAALNLSPPNLPSRVASLTSKRP